MNIFGEGLPEQIIGQINRRQQTYGSGYVDGKIRLPEEILVLNANTGWIKLLSSFNIPSLETKAINNPSIKQLNLVGDALAKTYVLFNGTEGSTERLRSGVSNENSFGGDNYAYGIGGTDFGLNPMMGITSMTVNHENRGSLRRAVVKIRAHNKVQFEIIDVLYLRLGFQVLLEWGNSIYINNKDKYESSNNWSLADDFLNGKGNVKNPPPDEGEKFKYFNYDDFLQRIHQNRLDSQGNYDAMFAKVTNFHWSVNKDGSYDIEVNLASIGDIIESLKVNVASKSPIQTKKQKIDLESEDIPKQQPFILSRGKSAIGDFLSMPLIEVSEAEREQANNIIGEFSIAEITTTGVAILAIVGTGLAIPVVNIAVAAGIIAVAGLYFAANAFLIADDDKTAGYIFFGHKQGNNTNDRWSSVPYLQILNAKKSPPINMNMNLDEFKDILQRDFININWDNAIGTNLVGLEATDPFTYVRLGTFLQFLQDVIVFQQKGVSANLPAKPGLRFDYDVETNIMDAYDRQVSFDPKICVVNRTIDLNFNPASKEFDDIYTFPYDFAPTNIGESPSALPQDGGKYISDNLKTIGSYGKIMNIFVNSRFILETIENNKDEQGDVILIDFLQKILDGISEGLGGLNNLDVFIDETLNMVKIIDKNPLKNRDTVLEYMNNNIPLFPYVHQDSSQKISTDLAKFQLFGYSGSSAGFVKDFTFKTELTPAFSTMITVGAAANKSVVGEENTALSRINKGLVDRYKETVVNIIDPKKLKEEGDKLQTAIAETEELLKIRNEEFEKFLYDMSYTAEEYSSQDGVEYNIDDINLHKTSLKELIDLEQKLKELIAKRDSEPTPLPLNTRDGFIPFNLSLTMDGLSGMKINEKFTVNTDFLPSNYPETVEFLIKNLTHEVIDNKWLTKIDSYCISKQAETLPVVKASPSPTPSPKTAPLPVKTPPVKKEEPAKTPSGPVTPCGISTVSSHPKTPSGPDGDYRGGITKWIGNIVTSAKCNLDTVTFDIYNPTPPVPNITKSGNMGCAAAVSLIFYRATGYSITQKQSPVPSTWPIANFPGNVGTTGLYAFFTNNPSLWKKYELKDAKPGDIIITERFSNTVAGHVGVVIDTINVDGTYDVISNSSSGFDGSRKGTIQQNYTIKKWIKKVMPKNPTKTFCFRYSGGFRP